MSDRILEIMREAQACAEQLVAARTEAARLRTALEEVRAYVRYRGVTVVLNPTTAAIVRGKIDAALAAQPPAGQDTE